MIKLSKASKMPCKSWSLQAIDTCPGSIDHNTGELVSACQGCYATTGNYRFPNVKAPRIHNKQDWKRGDWATDMVRAIEADSYFRWFDSGDVYAIKLARKILDVMKRTPTTQHWLPTRMYKFKKFLPVLREMAALPNVVVRFSSDGINGELVSTHDHSSTIIKLPHHCTDKNAVCGAYSRDGKCGSCRKCWDKDEVMIAYPQHGKLMARVNIQLHG